MKQLVRQRRLVILLASILVLLFAFPYFQGAPAEAALLNLLQVAMVIAAVAVVSTNWKHLVTAMSLGVLSLLSGWVPRSQEYPPIFIVGGFSAIAFYAYAVLMIIIHLLKQKEVTVDTLSGGFCGYFLIGLLWTEAFDLIEFYQPHSIIWANSPATPLNWSDLLYFSFTTLTTAGYGDVLPATGRGRSTALLESVSGVFYVAVMISRLVGLQIANRQNNDGER